MISRTGLEELIAPLFEINRRRARHVIEVIALAIPRERWAHGCAIARMEKIVWPGKVLCFCKSGGSVAKVWRVVVEKINAVLPRRAARESSAHRKHRLYR